MILRPTRCVPSPSFHKCNTCGVVSFATKNTVSLLTVAIKPAFRLQFVAVSTSMLSQIVELQPADVLMVKQTRCVPCGNVCENPIDDEAKVPLMVHLYD